MTNKSKIFDVIYMMLREDYVRGSVIILPETKIHGYDMGLDSLDTLELVMQIEEHFNMSISDEVATKWITIDDVVVYIESNS